MLQVRLLSGKEVAAMPVEEVRSVRDVKRRLHQLHGLPPRFRQRLMLQGSEQNLDDADALDSPMDLALVVVPFSSPSEAQVNELVAAAKHGSVDEAAVSRNAPCTSRKSMQ